MLAPWADQIYQWLTGDRLQVTRIHELLLARGCPVTYQSVRRFMERRHWRRPRKTTVRMEETPPGEVAEVDFGRLGLIHDPESGRRSAVWALIVVLGYSRHCFVWPTFNQKLEDVIAGLEAAWAFFGGIPRTRSWTIAPRRWRAPTRCILSSPGASLPTRPECVTPKTSPRWNGVCPTSGSASSRAVNSTACHIFGPKPSAGAPWWPDSASTAPPAANPSVFQDEERHALIPWDGEPYELAYWRNAKVHQDHHIQCQQALYSVPATLCPPGQRVEVRVDSKLVHIYRRGRLLKVHPRQSRGGRSTDPTDYPAELSAYTTRTPDRIKGKAQELGPAVAEFAERLFDGPLPWSRIRQGHKLLRLGERYTAQRLDAACRRPWKRRPCPLCQSPCPRAASPAQAASFPMPQAPAQSRIRRFSHDQTRRSYAPPQATQAGRHG